MKLSDFTGLVCGYSALKNVGPCPENLFGIDKSTPLSRFNAYLLLL